MKKLFIFLLTLSLFLIGFVAFAQADLSPTDKQQIAGNLDSLVHAINTGDIERVILLISPNNPILQAEVRERVRGVMRYQLSYAPIDKNIEMLATGQAKVKARFAAEGPGWSVSGLSNYFVFEKQNNQWFIIDTDFHKKLGTDYVFGILKKVFVFGGPIFLILFAFWLWMLIDCIKREFDDKALWIILIIFLSFIGVILYFFFVKRKNVTRKPLEFKV